MKSIRITGMSCGHCVAAVTKALQEIDGVTDVAVDLDTGEATWNEESVVAPEVVAERIRKAGYDAVD